MSRVSCSKEMFRSNQPSVCIQVGLPDPDRYSTMGVNPKGRREELVPTNSSRLQFRPAASGSEWICRESHNKHRSKWYNFLGEPPFDVILQWLVSYYLCLLLAPVAPQLTVVGCECSSRPPKQAQKRACPPTLMLKLALELTSCFTDQALLA